MILLMLVLVSCGELLSVSSHPRLPKVAKTYVVDLDKQPEDRWGHIVVDFSDEVAYFHKEMKKYIPGPLLPLVEEVASKFDNYLPQPYADEIKGVAKAVGLQVGDVFLLNVIYELTAYCTSIVGQDSQGRIWHGRNFDYGNNAEETDIFRNLTIQVKFQRNGSTVYFGTTVAGYVGLPTGGRPGVFTLSIDERDKGNIYENFFMAFVNGGIPVGMYIRDALETAKSFDTAIEILSTRKLVADMYLIVGGLNPGEGAVIARNRESVADMWRLDSKQSRWFLVETNYDHWLPPPTSDDRRTPAIKAMEKIGATNLNNATLLDALNTRLVLNRHTVHTVLMSARDMTVYKTLIRYDANTAPEANFSRQKYAPRMNFPHEKSPMSSRWTKI